MKRTRSDDVVRHRTALAKQYAGSENDFSQTREEWENAVFKNAVGFTSTIFRGRGQYETYEFKTPKEAMDKALSMGSHFGRLPLVYAYTENGRRVVLDRKEWPRYLELWAKR